MPHVCADVPADHADAACSGIWRPGPIRCRCSSTGAAVRRRARCVAALPEERQPGPRRGADRPLAGLRSSCEALIAQRDRRQADSEAAGRRLHPRRDLAHAEGQGRRRAVQADSALPQARADRLRRQLLGVPIDGDAARQHAVRQQRRSGVVGICTNPATLGAGSAPLRAYLSTGGRMIAMSGGAPKPWATDKTVDTPFVSVPGLLTAECKTNEFATYLEIKVNGDPADPRVDDITGDLGAAAKPLAQLGPALDRRESGDGQPARSRRRAVKGVSSAKVKNVTPRMLHRGLRSRDPAPQARAASAARR